ncbi:MAG: hypothetical protein AAGF95_32165 [Chloroflexota bacterium]
MLEDTTTITDSVPLVIVELPSGNSAAVLYTATFGELVVVFLLFALVVLHVIALWRSSHVHS